MLPCAILCGGLATRLRPMTESLPKSLVAVNGEPFIAHQLRLLRSRGIENVVLCVGYLGEMIEDYAGDWHKLGLTIHYSYDGVRLLGTAGALRKALTLLDDSFFVLYGDSYLPCDYRAIAESFRVSGRRGLMTIYDNAGKYDSSNVEAIDGRIVRYDKRNRSESMRYIDYGLGVFKRSVFEDLEPEQTCDLADVYQGLLAAGELGCFEVSERFYEAGSQAGLLDLAQYLSGTNPAAR